MEKDGERNTNKKTERHKDSDILKLKQTNQQTYSLVGERFLFPSVAHVRHLLLSVDVTPSLDAPARRKMKNVFYTRIDSHFINTFPAAWTVYIGKQSNSLYRFGQFGSLLSFLLNKET